MGWYDHRDGYKTLDEAAKFFNVTPNTVGCWIREGSLKAETFDGEKPKYWISDSAAEEFSKTYLTHGANPESLSKNGFTSIKDIAKMYDVRTASVRGWIEQGYLTTTKTLRGKKLVYMVSDESLQKFDEIYSQLSKNKNGHTKRSSMKHAFIKEDKAMADISNQETSSLEKFVNEVNAHFDNYTSLNASYNAVSNQMHKDIIKTMEIYGYTDIDENVMSHVLAITFRAPSLAKLRMDMDAEHEAIKKLFVDAGVTERLFWGDWSDE